MQGTRQDLQQLHETDKLAGMPLTSWVVTCHACHTWRPFCTMAEEMYEFEPEWRTSMTALCR